MSEGVLKIIIKDKDLDSPFDAGRPHQKQESLDRQLREIKQIIHTRDEFEAKYNRIFRKLSEILNFSSIFFFEHEEGRHEESTFSQRYLWDAENSVFVKEMIDTDNVPYAPYFDRWRALLSSGTVIQNMTKKLPSLEQEYLKDIEAGFVLVVPIFFDLKFVAFAQINYTAEQRLYTDNELALIRDVFETLYWAEKMDQTNREQKSELEALRTAHERKSSTLSNITHELQTPMNGIIGLTEQMDMIEDQESRKTYLESIKLSLSNLMTVINNILETSVVDQKSFELVEVPYDFRNTTRTMLQLHRQNAEEKGLEFEVEYSDDFPNRMIGDSRRVNQVISNVLDNAVKFTHEGNVKVRFDSEEEKDHTLLIVSVKDTGIGIDPNHHKIIFDKFVQLDADENRSYSGIGAGLTIVKDLVKAMKGEVSVISEPGEGSEFIIKIPTQPVHRNIAEYQDNTEVLGKLKFLVVDDNEINLKVVTTILEKWGSEYDVARNGQEAIDLAKENDYDIIFMDIQMPVMDGYEATRKIRKIKGIRPRILALTASILRENEYKCIQAGMDGVIRKPFFPDNLINWICNKGKEMEPESKSETEVNAPDAEPVEFEVIDMKYLEDIAAGNTEFIEEMINLFFDQVPEKLDTLGTAIENQDYETIAATSHKLKPIVGYVGLDPVALGVKEMEYLGNRNGDLSVIKKNYENVCESLNLAVKELKTYLTQI